MFGELAHVANIHVSVRVVACLSCRLPSNFTTPLQTHHLNLLSRCGSGIQIVRSD